MKACEHEYENANCTNCANGLPYSGYECAKTKGTLKEYCHDKAEEIHRQKYNEGYEQGYEQGRAEVIDELVRPLQNRCFALTQGQMCFFCPMECEHRKAKFRNDERLKEQAND